MGRPTNLWVVQDKDDVIVAAFSVKHELQTYLELPQNLPEMFNITYVPNGYQLNYTPDGGYVYNYGKVPVKVDPRTLKPLE
jgi:hypothetical protein